MKQLLVLLLESRALETGPDVAECLDPRRFRLCHDSFEAGLSRLSQDPFDVVLVEIGREEELQSTLARVLAPARSVPVITIGQEHIAVPAVAAGAEDHIGIDQLTPHRMSAAIGMAIERSARWNALEANEARLRTLIETSADSLVVVDESGTIRFVNQAAEKLFACGGEQLVGSMMGTPSHRSGTAELEIVRGDTQETIAAEMRVVEIEWQGQTGYIESIRDITQRKKEEQQARDAVRMRDHFLATLSHELRNPLAAMNNAASLLSQRPEDPQSLTFPIEVIQRQSRHMVRLLDDLLDISRISQGKVELRKEYIAVQRVIADVLQSVGTRVQSTHRLTVEVPEPLLYLHADPSRIQQVLVNLLTNAAKYTDDGGDVRLAVRCEERELRISVRDNGHGVSAEFHDSIFEPFVQIEQTLVRSDGGLGIGLALVRRLAELHGGRAGVSSDGIGTGAEFFIYLPLASPPPEQPQPKTHLRSDRLRIVIVEDNEDAALTLKLLLAIKGHHVEVARDGRTGLELILTSIPDVALVDIGLPQLDGFQVAEQVKKCPVAVRTCLVAMTGYGSPEDRRRALEAGFTHHLVKPVALQELEQCLVEIATNRS